MEQLHNDQPAGENDPLEIPSESIPPELKNNVFITAIDGIYNWGRVYSIWPMMFGLACCAIEFIAAAASRYDIDRFGAGLTRPSPRQSDLMIVSGTVTKKMAPLIVRLYNQMPEPKYVLSMGSCANGGGPFKEGYNVVSGIDQYIPVDVYVPGCPPSPQAFLQGLLKIQEKFRTQSIRTVPWYKKGEREEAIPIPILGPDIIDPRKILQIKQTLAELREKKAAELSAQADAPEQKEAPKSKAVPKLEKLPQWDITPNEASLRLAEKINETLAAPAVTVEKEALIVDRGYLLKVGEYLRDQPELKFDHLSNVTGVDYLGREPRFEVVYHLFSTHYQGSGLVLKCRAPENELVIPSLVPLWPSANLQEREIYDLYGVTFPGHPHLKRILLWEGFNGHPMRKDYHEGYFEETAKPFNSRWPAGHFGRGETTINPFGHNLVYPPDFDPETYRPPAENLRIVEAEELAGVDKLVNDRIVVNMGPQHPSTHGVFRMVVELNGEIITALEPIVGYLHRNHEKIGERNSWIMNMPYTDRLDYFNTMGNNFAYALAVEKMLGLAVPERAEYIRVIMAEMNRILSHLVLAGFLLNDLGAMFTPLLYALEERELILDLFEEASGSRLMSNFFRFGGVAYDLSDDWLKRANILAFERLPKALDQMEQLLDENEILVARTRGVGIINAEQAVALGITGPMLRASGVAYDNRRAHPYSIYDRFDFDIPTLQHGDLYDRYFIRILEARQALRILQQALKQIPAGEYQGGRRAWQVRVPAGDVYVPTEHSKGELGFYLVSNGGPNPYRYRVRSPSFINITALPAMAIGQKVADTIVLLGAIDLVLGEVDR